MFEKILCAICWMAWVLMFLALLSAKAENRELRSAFNEPVNCEAVCETLFEEMGC